MNSHNLSQHTVSRRSLLETAALAGGMWLTPIAHHLARAAEKQQDKKPAQSIILLWLSGGPSQLETFDPHPGKSIAAGSKARKTSLPGVQIGSGFEQLADQMEQVAIIRSLTSKEGDHQRGVYHLKTGYRPTPTLVHPSIGAIACHQLNDAGVDIPRHISILPDRWSGRGGFLGARFDAFQTGDPKNSVPDVTPRVSPKRNQRRLAGLDVVENNFARGRSVRSQATRHRETIDAAQRMMTSEQLAAFDISSEPRALQEQYGATPFGRGCLAARRLTEVGVRCVEVTLPGWDTHLNNHEQHARLIAQLDPALAALIADLRDRAALERTLVLCGGEFGRTPQLNRLEGRDHWPHNFCFVLSGGGIQGGQVIGESDPAGGRKVVEPVTVSDLHATLLTALGINPRKELTTPGDRPIKLSEGTAIKKLLARV